MRRLTVLPAAVLALGLLAGCGTPATTGPAFVAEVQTRIDAAMRDNVIPGAIVRIASPTDGEWTGTFGTATLGTDDPMTVDDHVRAGSITKTMTSTVILQLLQEGKLALTDPIGKYRAGVPNGDRVTIAQLAEMRSGLYSYTFDRGFNETLDADPGKAWTPDELLANAFAHPPAPRSSTATPTSSSSDWSSNSSPGCPSRRRSRNASSPRSA